MSDAKENRNDYAYPPGTTNPRVTTLLNLWHGGNDQDDAVYNDIISSVCHRLAKNAQIIFKQKITTGEALSRHADAMDIFQDVLTNEFKKALQAGRPENTATLIGNFNRVFTNTLIDAVRKTNAQKRGGGKSRLDRPDNRYCNESNEVDDGEVSQLLKERMKNEMGPEEVECLVWEYGAGMNVREIAEEMGISYDRARNLKKRALAKAALILKKLIE